MDDFRKITADEFANLQRDDKLTIQRVYLVSSTGGRAELVDKVDDFIKWMTDAANKPFIEYGQLIMDKPECAKFIVHYNRYDPERYKAYEFVMYFRT